MKDESQPLQFNFDTDSDDADPEFSEGNHTQRGGESNDKWITLLQEEIEEEKPRMHILERIKLREEKEKRQMEEADARSIREWKITEKLEPNPKPEPPPEPSEEEKEAIRKTREKELEEVAIAQKALEKELEEDAKKEAELLRQRRIKERQEHEERIRKRREQQPLEYFWKPDPLYYMHLVQIGYSSIAAEKALYYTDNKSVDIAEKYIIEHPNLSPLTKEEVMADADAFLAKIRPKRSPSGNHSASSSSSEDESKMEDETQAMELEIPEISYHEDKKESQKEDSEEKVTVHHEEKVKAKEAPKPFEEKVELLFMVNPDPHLNSPCLAIVCAKVTMKIMEQLQGDEWRTLYEEWKKNGQRVNAYNSSGAFHLYQLRSVVESEGFLHYLAEIPNPSCTGVSLPAVLGILSQKKCVRRICPRLPQIN